MTSTYRSTPRNLRNSSRPKYGSWVVVMGGDGCCAVCEQSRCRRTAGHLPVVPDDELLWTRETAYPATAMAHATPCDACSSSSSSTPAACSSGHGTRSQAQAQAQRDSLGTRNAHCLRPLAFHAQKAPSLQISGTAGASSDQAHHGWNDGTFAIEGLGWATHHTGTGRTPEWMRQASQGVWHRASSSEPGQVSDTGDARLALNGNPWGLRSGRLEGLEVENLRELGRGDVVLRPLDCKRQHWPLASDNGLTKDVVPASACCQRPFEISAGTGVRTVLLDLETADILAKHISTDLASFPRPPRLTQSLCTVHRDAASTADFTWQAHTLQSTMRCTATWCIHANNSHRVSGTSLSRYVSDFGAQSYALDEHCEPLPVSRSVASRSWNDHLSSDRLIFRLNWHSPSWDQMRRAQSNRHDPLNQTRLETASPEEEALNVVVVAGLPFWPSETKPTRNSCHPRRIAGLAWQRLRTVTTLKYRLLGAVLALAKPNRVPVRVARWCLSNSKAIPSGPVNSKKNQQIRNSHPAKPKISQTSDSHVLHSPDLHSFSTKSPRDTSSRSPNRSVHAHATRRKPPRHQRGRAAALANPDQDLRQCPAPEQFAATQRPQIALHSSRPDQWNMQTASPTG
ncbi:hypothetical protein V8E51_018087 [Hyaloscypha variabilis]